MLESQINKPISILRSNKPNYKKEREANPKLHIRYIAIKIMEVVLDQGGGKQASIRI